MFTRLKTRRSTMSLRMLDIYSEDGVDFSDPIMWSDSDGELSNRVGEVLCYFEQEHLPEWWRKRVRPYIVSNVLMDAEAQGCGVVYNKITNLVYVDIFADYPAFSLVFQR